MYLHCPGIAERQLGHPGVHLPGGRDRSHVGLAGRRTSRPKLSTTKGEDSDIRIAHCPERVLPGKVMQELITNDRIIGGMTRRCSELACALYRAFVTGECVVASSPRVAEMAKLTENSFRDVNIAFANELSLICGKLGMNVWELISLANRHPRVNILQPGPGVGGHCIAVDPWFIVSSAPEEARLIQTARLVNDHKPEWVLKKVERAIEKIKQELKEGQRLQVAVYGLAFKADIDDLRESPALDIAREISLGHDGETLVVEPNISVLPQGFSINSKLASLSDAATAQISVLLVDHREFKKSPPPNGVILDFKGIWKGI